MFANVFELGSISWNQAAGSALNSCDTHDQELVSWVIFTDLWIVIALDLLSDLVELLVREVVCSVAGMQPELWRVALGQHRWLILSVLGLIFVHTV